MFYFASKVLKFFAIVFRKVETERRRLFWRKNFQLFKQQLLQRGKNGPCEAGALIAVVNDYVFVDKIYSRDASRMGQAGTLRHPLRAQGGQLQCKHEQWSQKRLKINEKKSQSFSTFNGFLIFISCKFFHIAHRKVISKLNFILLHSNVKSLHFGHFNVTTKLS